jgi:hypothetical protein
MTDSSDLVRRYSQEDYLAATIRVTLGLTGGVGLFLGEFLTQFVPGQRLDRLQEFVEQLDERLKGLEEQFKTRAYSSSAFSALVEEASLAAVRTPSIERRRDLAELLRTGMAQSDAELLHHHAMLNLLERINDAQVLILMRYGTFKSTFDDPELEAFLQFHRALFDVEPPSFDDGEEKARSWYVYRHYEDELVPLGLLEDTEGVAKSGRHRRLAITPLGKMLLDAIGRSGRPEIA